jgi:hypothetical protein
MSRRDLQEISATILDVLRVAHQAPGSFSPREETLTELALVELKQRMSGTSVIQKPSTKVESKEGHDWVWTIQSRHGYATFRVQAKKLYQGGRYDQLNHHHKLKPSGVELQLERLIATAHTQGHAPIYAFFNGDSGVFAHDPVEQGACTESPLQRSHPPQNDYSPLGITLVDAHWVRHHMPPCSPRVPPVPDTSDLNQAAMPWECLLGCFHSVGNSPGPTHGGADPADDQNGDGGEGPTQDPETEDVSGQSPEAGADSGDPSNVPLQSKSYLRKLRQALITGEQEGHLTGFSEYPPSWVQQSGEIIVGGWWPDGPEEQMAVYRNIEPNLEDSQRPSFYVLTPMVLPPEHVRK